MSFLVDCKSQNCGYWNRTDLTTAYFDDIKDYPVLSSNEERKLLERVKSNNPVISQNARKKLVECNQRFVVSVARRWQKGDNLMDIVNEANIGLLHAIDNYDLNKKQRFITYAVWWIRKYINDYIVFKEKPVVPANAIKLYTYVPKVRNKFFIKNHRYPTFDELKEILKNEYKVVVTHNEDLGVLSMASIDDTYFEPNEHALSEDTLAFENITSSNNIEENTDKSDVREIVKTLLNYLNEKEKKVVKLFYGIDCCETGLDTIGVDMDISKERVRQILNSSLKKMAKKHTLISKI
jgi:RNA polymerase primary sigma factor